MLESLFSKVAGLRLWWLLLNLKILIEQKKKKRAANVVQVLKLTSTKAYSKDDVTGRFLKDTPSILAKPICEIFQ